MLTSLLLLLCPTLPTLAQDRVEEALAKPEPPRLVVLLAIDQFIPEQMDRLEPHLKGGLLRIQQEGVRFGNAALPYSSTETGPGHATMATGCLPRTHGIVGNTLRLREEARTLYCVADPSARHITSAGMGGRDSVSSLNLSMPSLGDYLKAKDGGSQVVTVSGKDRSAVCLGGRNADLALWWSSLGGFQTSTAYAMELPKVVNDFNAKWVERSIGYVWDATFDLDNPPAKTSHDDREGEGKFPDGDRGFPHTFGGTPGVIPVGDELKVLSRQVQFSALGDNYSIEMAMALVAERDLGGDEIPDMLGLALSGVDKVGHINGPYSSEVTDCILRIDRGLGSLFAMLDERVGKDRWVLAMTADHGVLPLVESDSKLHGIHGLSRVTKDQIKAAQKAVTEALKAEFGVDKKKRGLRPHFHGGNVYFEPEDLTERGIDPGQARRVAAATLAKEDWIIACYPLEELASDAPTTDDFLRLYRNAYDARYSPDVTIMPRKGSI